MRKDALEVMARLMAMAEIKEAQIKSNPIPYLEKAYEELAAARECFEKIEYALSPDIIFDIADGSGIKPTNINGEAYIRCEKAKEVIREYMKGKAA